MELIPGIIYYQTSQYLNAVSMHDGAPLWKTDLPSRSLGNTSPIVATPVGMNSRYFIYTFTKDMNDAIFINSMACCSGNGICGSGQMACRCNTNYFGANCENFCDIKACGGNGNVGGNCTNTGCTCNTGYYGPLCNCNPTTTCHGHGVCSTTTTGAACTCSSGTFDFAIPYGLNCEVSQTNWFLVGCIIAAALILLLLIILIILVCTTKTKKGQGKKE